MSKDALNSRPIFAISQDTGVSIKFSSIRQAAKVLDLDPRSIKNVLNVENRHKGSPSTGEMYRFYDPELPDNQIDKGTNKHRPYIEGIDRESIPDGHIWAFDKDLNKVAEFASGRYAAEGCGVTETTVSRNLNRVFTKCVFLGQVISLLLANNLKDSRVKAIPITVKDLQENTTSHFSSQEEVKRVLQLPKGGYLKSYINTGKVYKKRYIFNTTETHAISETKKS